ncbi:MAG: Hsp70 family protein [Methanoregula sp.]|nr:Hsp70 family protein [Methanoregula sp.]
MMNRNILGIDFGTTNSKMAYMLLDEPEIIVNIEGKTITPSIVHFKNEDEYVVGEPAKRTMIMHPDKVVSSIKREMGTDYKKQIGRFKFPPEYIGALIIKKLVDDAETRLGKKFIDVVVSVPANYTDSQRQSIRDAAEMAGVNVLRLINEPTAAALAYGIREDRDRKVLVYDFGGGTFDVSILSVSSGFFDVDASTGEHRLGGDDIDARIVEHVTKKLHQQLGVDVKKDLALQATIKEASEEAKIALSTAESTTINIPFVVKGKPPFSMVLTQKSLNTMISDLIKRTKIPIDQALADASLEKSEIDDILLVGGTTLIPAVRTFVKEYFGKEPMSGDPYTAVALGAAIAGTEYIQEKSRAAKNIEISDVVSCSLGVRVADGTLSKIIDRNTKIPIARTRVYTNAGDFSEEVIIPVFQGEEEVADENEFLGDFWISIEPMPACQNQIEVTFEVGAEFGILNINAIDTISGNKRTVKMESRSRLSKKEKNKWMKKIIGVESVHVDITNKPGKVTLDMFLNPHGTVSDLKRELLEKGVIGENETIVFDDIEPDDSERIDGLNIKDDSVIEIRRTDEQKK